jgi:hypothetical protein
MPSSSSTVHHPEVTSIGVPRQHSKTHKDLPVTRQPTPTNPSGCKLDRQNFPGSPASPLKLLYTPLLQTGRRIRGNCGIKVCVNLTENRHTTLQVHAHANATSIDASLPAFRFRSCSWGSIRLPSPYSLRRSTSTGSANNRPMHSGVGIKLTVNQSRFPGRPSRTEIRPLSQSSSC